MAMVIGLASGPVVWPLADSVAAGGKLLLMDQATGALDRFAGGPALAVTMCHRRVA
jgi:hypothetical protein